MFLGVDGGGTKTAYALIDAAGRIRALHYAGTVSHLSEGLEGAEALLAEGIRQALAQGRATTADVSFAFFGLPAYGEDSATTARQESMPAALLERTRYRVGNDMICSWAGSLACRDGISVIAGTGSMAYGEYAGRSARAGGWGELIGDEGSAYWIAREGMNLFSRMSDGRTAQGPLYSSVRDRFGLDADLDLCARIYGMEANARNAFAQFAPLVQEAARAGDEQAGAIFRRAAEELAQTVIAVRRSLEVPTDVVLPVSYSGGAFGPSSLLLDAFRAALAGRPGLECRTPLLPPVLGAALYAARLGGVALSDDALATLGRQWAVTGHSA